MLILQERRPQPGWPQAKTWDRPGRSPRPWPRRPSCPAFWWPSDPLNLRPGPHVFVATFEQDRSALSSQHMSSTKDVSTSLSRKWIESSPGAGVADPLGGHLAREPRAGSHSVTGGAEAGLPPRGFSPHRRYCSRASPGGTGTRSGERTAGGLLTGLRSNTGALGAPTCGPQDQPTTPDGGLWARSPTVRERPRQKGQDQVPKGPRPE